MIKIRDDTTEALPILAQIDALTALGEARHREMHEGQVKDLTHPFDLLTSEEKSKFHFLKGMLRPKSQEEARADIMKRRNKKSPPN